MSDKNKPKEGGEAKTDPSHEWCSNCHNTGVRGDGDTCTSCLQ